MLLIKGVLVAGFSVKSQRTPRHVDTDLSWGSCLSVLFLLHLLYILWLGSSCGEDQRRLPTWNRLLTRMYNKPYGNSLIVSRTAILQHQQKAPSQIMEHLIAIFSDSNPFVVCISPGFE
jgi:hypothetical protein